MYYAAEQALSASLDTTLRETASVAQASVDREDGGTAFKSDLRPTGDLSIELMSARERCCHGQETWRTPRERYPVVPGFSTGDTRRILTSRLGNLYLRVSRPTEALSGFLETLAQLLLIGSVFMIAVACGAGYWLAHRALGPVDAVARTAESIAARGDYAERVPQAPGSDEMARLTRTVNLMLDGLAGTIEREQHSRARQPTNSNTADRVERPPGADAGSPRKAAEYQKALTGMVGRVEALSALTEGLLALARTDAPAKLEEVELAGIAAEVAEGCEDMAQGCGKHIRLDPGASVGTCRG